MIRRPGAGRDVDPVIIHVKSSYQVERGGTRRRQAGLGVGKVAASGSRTILSLVMIVVLRSVFVVPTVFMS